MYLTRAIQGVHCSIILISLKCANLLLNIYLRHFENIQIFGNMFERKFFFCLASSNQTIGGWAHLFTNIFHVTKDTKNVEAKNSLMSSSWQWKNYKSGLSIHRHFLAAQQLLMLVGKKWESPTRYVVWYLGKLSFSNRVRIGLASHFAT